MTTEKTLVLLRAAVQARLRYWDAVRELEKATAPDGHNWSDQANNEVEGQIGMLAAGLHGPDDVEAITEEYAVDTLRLARI